MPQYRPKDYPKTIHYRIFSCGQRPSLNLAAQGLAGDVLTGYSFISSVMEKPSVSAISFSLSIAEKNSLILGSQLDSAKSAQGRLHFGQSLRLSLIPPVSLRRR